MGGLGWDFNCDFRSFMLVGVEEKSSPNTFSTLTHNSQTNLIGLHMIWIKPISIILDLKKQIVHLLP